MLIYLINLCISANLPRIKDSVERMVLVEEVLRLICDDQLKESDESSYFQSYCHFPHKSGFSQISRNCQNHVATLTFAYWLVAKNKMNNDVLTAFWCKQPLYLFLLPSLRDNSRVNFNFVDDILVKK